MRPFLALVTPVGDFGGVVDPGFGRPGPIGGPGGPGGPGSPGGPVDPGFGIDAGQGWLRPTHPIYNPAYPDHTLPPGGGFVPGSPPPRPRPQPPGGGGQQPAGYPGQLPGSDPSGSGWIYAYVPGHGWMWAQVPPPPGGTTPPPGGTTPPSTGEGPAHPIQPTTPAPKPA